jgi:ferredoxin-type protein NapH
LGLVMDIAVLFRKAFKIRYRNLSEKLNLRLHQLRYIILLFFLFTPIILWLIQPPPNIDFAMVMVKLLAGPFRPYSVLIDPMIPFIVPWTSATVSVFQVNFTFPYAQEFITYAGQNIGQVIAIAFVGLTLVGSFLIRRFWCRFCPTAASLTVLNRFNGFRWAPLLHLEKDEEKCTKCGVCKRVCQVQVTEVYEQRGGKINTSMCMLCLRCAEMCPYEDTLKLKFGNKTLFKSRNWLEPPKNE